MAATEDEEKPAAEEAPAKKGKSKLLLILIPVILLLVGGGAFFMLGSSPEPVDEDYEPPRSYATLKLEPFIVNLSDSSSYIKLTMVIEYDEEMVAAASLTGGAGGAGHGGGGAGGGPVEVGPPPLFTKRDPMLRDAVIRVLSQKTKEQVLSAVGKEDLREELMDAINDALGLDDAAIVAVYFLEYIVQ